MFATSALRVLVIVLVTLLSGAPRAMASVVAGGEPKCSTPCDGDKAGHEEEEEEDADDVCSPICSTGPCAKVLSTIASVMFVELEVSIEGRELALLNRAVDVPDGVSDGVFHPPRA